MWSGGCMHPHRYVEQGWQSGRAPRWSAPPPTPFPPGSQGGMLMGAALVGADVDRADVGVVPPSWWYENERLTQGEEKQGARAAYDSCEGERCMAAAAAGQPWGWQDTVALELEGGGWWGWEGV